MSADAGRWRGPWRSRSRPGRKAQAGLTLSEVLVAMGLTGLVTVMVFGMSQLIGDSQQREESTQYVQDNVRSATEELLRGVQKAGTSFLSRQAQNAVPPRSPASVWAVRVVDNPSNAPSSNGPDALELIRIDDSVRSTLMQDTDGQSSSLLVDSAAGLRGGSYVVLSDFQSAILYRLTTDPTPQTLYGNQGNIPVQQLIVTPPPSAPSFALSAGAMVNLAQPVRYSVSTTLMAGTPTLVLQDGAPVDSTQPLQVVADHIEDLQVALGVDGLLNGLSDGQLSEVGAAAGDDEWIYNVAGESFPAALPQGAQVIAVRITVIGRTREVSEALGPGRPAAENRPAGAPDGYRRRVLSTVIGLRSLLTS